MTRLLATPVRACCISGARLISNRLSKAIRPVMMPAVKVVERLTRKVRAIVRRLCAVLGEGRNSVIERTPIKKPPEGGNGSGGRCAPTLESCPAIMQPQN